MEHSRLLTKRVEAGEQADALVLIKNNVESLLKEGKIVPGTETLFGQSIFAVGVKTGTPKPDVSTPEAFKKSLLSAKGVSYSNPASGGASGVYIAKQIDKMGIADQLKDKTKFPPSGGFSGTLLVSGDADIAIQSKPNFCRFRASKWSGRSLAIWHSLSYMRLAFNREPRKQTWQRLSSIS